MATVTFTTAPMRRYYRMAVATSAVSIPADSLKSFAGEQVIRAVGVVTAGSVRMGIESVLSATSIAGLPLAVSDVIVLEGRDNIRSATFIQDSGAAVIFWVLQAER